MNIKTEIDELKKDSVDRCSLQEVLSIKQNIMGALEHKVELKEVQSVLNDC